MRTRNKEVLDLPISRKMRDKPHKQGEAYAPVSILKKSTYRRCPNCQSKHVKRNGKSRRFGKYRYLCKKCKKGFTMNIDAIDVKRLFNEVYDDLYCNIPHMLNTKYRKVRAFESNVKVRRCFSDIIAEYNSDKGFSDNERDEYAFNIACQLADTLDQNEVDKFCDSWYYLANYNNSDVTYRLEYYNNVLVRQYDMKLSQVQNIQPPLLHCSKCGSDDLTTHGFNNNARRRIKCLKCKRMSVISVKHLITKEEFEVMLHAYFIDKTDNEELIKQLTDRMKDDYFKISISRHFEALLDEQQVITHQLKQDIFNAFISAEYLRTIQKDLLNMTFKAMGYKSLYNSYKQIPFLPKSKNLIGMHRKLHMNLKYLAEATEAEVKYNRLFYQVAAAMMSPHFHDWEHRADLSFDELKTRLFNS